MIEQIDKIPQEVLVRTKNKRDGICCNDFKSMIQLDRLMNDNNNYDKCPYCGKEVI